LLVPSIILVFVVKVAFVSDGFAETECEDDAQDLKGDDPNGDSDDHVQVADEEFVHSIVAPLKIR
jgi:hypothetical protein